MSVRVAIVAFLLGAALLAAGALLFGERRPTVEHAPSGPAPEPVEPQE